MVSQASDGRKQVSGGDGLKETQTCPPLFGAAVASVASAHRCELVHSCASRTYGCALEVSMDELFYDSDEWGDADLHPIFDLLMSLCVKKHGL